MFWIGYRFIVFLFELAMHFSSIWDSRSLTYIEGRRDQDKKLKSWLSANGLPLIQIHCASLGEFELSLPLYESLSKEYPKHKFLFSFFSSSGYDHAKIPEGCAKSYLPTDRPGMVKNFLNLIQPSLVIFIKYEYWFEYLQQLNKRNIPFGYVNINHQSHPFNLSFATTKKIVNLSSFIFATNSKTSLDLIKNGIRVDEKYLDLRYTKSIQLLNEKYEPDSEIHNFLTKDRVIICGSVWEEDLKIIIPLIKLFQNFKWVLAPHKIDKASLTYIQNQIPDLSIFSTGRIKSESSVLLVDTIGDLKYLYRYGALNYIGGAFNTGLHNVLEPISTGAPIVFGTNYKGYPEAVQLINTGQGFSINNKEEFADIIKKLEMGSLHLDPPMSPQLMNNDLMQMTHQIGKLL